MRTRSKIVGPDQAPPVPAEIPPSPWDDPTDHVPFPPPGAETRDQVPRERFVDAAAALKGHGWGQIGDVLDTTTVVQTPFVGFDLATGVGGLPSRRVVTVHGPTHQGKTLFALGLIKGFAAQGHAAAYIDAEHATPEDFATQVLGELDQYPNVIAMRPKTFEIAVDATRRYLDWCAGQRKTNPGFRAILLVDSINKLVPEREMERVSKQASDALEQGGGRHRAMLNQAWLDQLVVALPSAECTAVMMAWEHEEAAAPGRWMPTIKVKGGAALLFDASMVIRVTKGVAIEHGEKQIVGFRHNLRITKNKVAAMDGKWTETHFYTSNGTLTPVGLDLARDLMEVAKAQGILAQAGGWYQYGRQRWQGEARFLADLARDQDLFHDIDQAVRARVAK